MPDPGNVTYLLQRADQGDAEAANDLFRLVEAQLRARARQRLKQFPGLADVSSLDLVHQAYVGLVGQNATVWNPGDRCKFFNYASKKMQCLLMDELRRRQAEKRPQEADRVPGGEEQVVDPRSQDLDLLLDLQESLDQFEAAVPEEALLFRLRYFLGCTFEEVAALLSISATEAKRRFARVKLYLQSKLKEYRLDA